MLHIRKSHINKYEKNEKDNKYANISSYIPETDMMKYTIHPTNCRTKMISSTCRCSHSYNKEDNLQQ